MEWSTLPLFVWQTIMYIIVIVTSLFGNVAVVLVVWRNKRMRTATNYFFVNLAISDLMVTSSCTWVHLVDDMTDGWVLGSFFCKFNSFAQGKNTLYLKNGSNPCVAFLIRFVSMDCCRRLAFSCGKWKKINRECSVSPREILLKKRRADRALTNKTI